MKLELDAGQVGGINDLLEARIDDALKCFKGSGDELNDYLVSLYDAWHKTLVVPEGVKAKSERIRSMKEKLVAAGVEL